MARILITGGGGFIGSHACVVLIEAGYDLIVIDSFINSSPICLERVGEITRLKNNLASQRLHVIRCDVRDSTAIHKVFEDSRKEMKPIDAVMHFAGLKSVHESIKNPLAYWDVNVNGSRSLLSVMERFNCKTFIFSSSATLYGAATEIPIRESAAIRPINPYGNSKAAVERLLIDLFNSNNEWNIACLRYFNPVGAHPSGLIGEDPLGTPNNLFPFISQVAIGRQDSLKIFGGDWDTADGTCIRDYIHTMDLAEGHLAALNFLLNKKGEMIIVNLGSGTGHSVLEVVKEFEKVTGIKIKSQIVGRRPGDAAITVADPALAKEILKWETKRSLHEMCLDGWVWQKANPYGY